MAETAYVPRLRTQYEESIKADLLKQFGMVVSSTHPMAELLNVPIPRIGALLPYILLVLILFFRPRGLMGTRDT